MHLDLNRQMSMSNFDFEKLHIPILGQAFKGGRSIKFCTGLLASVLAVASAIAAPDDPQVRLGPDGKSAIEVSNLTATTACPTARSTGTILKRHFEEGRGFAGITFKDDKFGESYINLRDPGTIEDEKLRASIVSALDNLLREGERLELIVKSCGAGGRIEKLDAARHIVAVPATAATISPTATMGRIEGRLAYPSDFIPSDLNACAENIDTKATVCTSKKIKLPNKGGTGYQLSVPAGTYYVFAILPLDSKDNYNKDGSRAYYSELVTCGYDARTCKSHALIPVVVEAGKTVKNISPGDYYDDKQVRQPVPDAVKGVGSALLTAQTDGVAFEPGEYEGTADYGGYLGLSVTGASAAIEVGKPGCLGDTKGKLKKVRAGHWEMRPDWPGCVIRFKRDGNRVKIKESSKCFQLHGASCNFDGSVSIKRKPTADRPTQNQ